MQFAKDSFYLAMRERMMALNPQRRIVVDGVSRVGIFASENEPSSGRVQQDDSFYLRWGGCRRMPKHSGGGRQLHALECVIAYGTRGSCESGVDRGRLLGALDRELISICHPPETRKRDFTQAPSVDLGSNVFWTDPELGELEASGESELRSASGGGRVRRSARLTVFFFPEVEFS